MDKTREGLEEESLLRTMGEVSIMNMTSTDSWPVHCYWELSNIDEVIERVAGVTGVAISR